MKCIKYFSAIGLIGFTLALPSCKEDVTTEELTASFDRLEERIEALEAVQEQVENLAKLLNASAKNYLIRSAATDENGNTTVVFADGTKAVFKNGEAGYTPSVGVKPGDDGLLYWAIDGEFMLDAENQKVSVQPVAKLPQFKFENNVWEYSFDGQSWTRVEGGDFLANKVSYTEDKDSYTFTIGNQSGIRVGKYRPLEVLFISEVNNNGTQFLVSNEAAPFVTLNYTILGMEDVASHLVMALASNGFTAEINKESRTITINKTSGVWDKSELTVILGDGGQRTIVRKLQFVSSLSGDNTQLSPSSNQENELPVASKATQQIISVTSDFLVNDVKATSDADWVTINAGSQIQSSRAASEYKLILDVVKNNTTQERTATVTVTAEDKVISFTIRQAAKEATDPNVALIEFDGSGDIKGFIEAFMKENPEESTKKAMKIVCAAELDDSQQGAITQLFRANGSLKNFETLDLSEANIKDLYWFNKGVALKSLILPEGMETIQMAALSESNYTELVIPASVKHIYHDAFGKCTALTKVTFKGRSDLTLPDGTLSVRAFNGCTALKEIVIAHPLQSGEALPSPGNSDMTGWNYSFRNLAPGFTLYVPAVDVEKYKADTDGWNKLFGGRIEAIK